MFYEQTETENIRSLEKCNLRSKTSEDNQFPIFARNKRNQTVNLRYISYMQNVWFCRILKQKIFWCFYLS